MPVDATRKPAPPARKTPAPRPAVVTPEGERSSREKGLLGYVQTASLAAVMRGWLADAGAIGQHGPGICREVARLADTNESIAKTVDYLVAAGPYTALIAAVLPLAVQIGVNHGRISADAAGMGGILPPDVLAAQVKTEIDIMRLEAAREAEKARREVEELQRQLAGSGNGSRTS